MSSRQPSTRIDNDPRFAQIRLDPRYKKSGKREGPGQWSGSRDTRFQVGDDDLFVRDKRGGVRENKRRIDEEMEEMGYGKVENRKKGREVEESEERVESEQRSEDGEEEEVVDGESGVEEGEEERDEDDSAEDIDMDKVNELLGNKPDEEEDAWSDSQEEKAPMFEGASKRLALMGYDWSKIKAGDLMITFSSFLPEGGILKRVSVYPSEFGKQRMAQEEVEGPGDIFKEEKPNKQEEQPTKKKNKKDGVEEKTLRRQREAEQNEWVAGIDEDSGLDLAKLRKYERDRLKYYYAVLEFDSAKTADHVYEACNGFELEKTGIKIGKQVHYPRSASSARRSKIPIRRYSSLHGEAIHSE
jgi:hypothetical protein